MTGSACSCLCGVRSLGSIRRLLLLLLRVPQFGVSPTETFRNGYFDDAISRTHVRTGWLWQSSFGKSLTRAICVGSGSALA